MIKAARKNIFYVLRNFIGSHRGLFWLFRFTKYSERMVGGNTHLCIEGFPRSANSFFYNYFKYFNPNVSIAHHVHVSEQAKKAARMGAPCVIVTREPVEAILSLLIIDETLSPSIAIKSYIAFHRNIQPVLPNCIVSDFSDSTGSPHAVVVALNQRFGKNYNYSFLTDVIEEKIFSRLRNVNAKDQPINQVAIPMEAKTKRKELLRSAIEPHPLMDEARKWHRLTVRHPSHVGKPTD